MSQIKLYFLYIVLWYSRFTLTSSWHFLLINLMCQCIFRSHAMYTVIFFYSIYIILGITLIFSHIGRVRFSAAVPLSFLSMVAKWQDCMILDPHGGADINRDITKRHNRRLNCKCQHFTIIAVGNYKRFTVSACDEFFWDLSQQQFHSLYYNKQCNECTNHLQYFFYKIIPLLLNLTQKLSV